MNRTEGLSEILDMRILKPIIWYYNKKSKITHTDTSSFKLSQEVQSFGSPWGYIKDVIVPFEIVTNGNVEHFSRVDSLKNRKQSCSTGEWVGGELLKHDYSSLHLDGFSCRRCADKIDSLLKCALFGWWYYFRNSGVMGEFLQSKWPIRQPKIVYQHRE